MTCVTSMSAAMSCTTACDSRRVTVFQCRSMKTKATTDCSSTIGTIMISSVRAYSPFGMKALKRRPIQLLAAETRPAAVRIMVRPVSSVLMRRSPALPSSPLPALRWAR